VGNFVNVQLTYAPDVVIKGIAVEAAGWPNLFQPELQEVGLASILSLFGLVCRGTILLKDVVTPRGHSVYPQLHNVSQHLYVFFCIDC
jgi:hypothetical protein